MRVLPAGWRVATVGELADTALGKMLDKGRPRGHDHVPYLRNVNVQWGRIDIYDILTMEISSSEQARFEVRAGDLLVCEGGEIGRAALWRGGFSYIAYQKALHRIRSRGQLLPTYLRYMLEQYANDGTLARFSTGSTIAHLPQEQLRRLPVPLPDVAEQRRIVEILEDHLSRLDAADGLLRVTELRLAALETQTVRTALTGDAVGIARPADLTPAGVIDGPLPGLPEGWTWMRLGEFADVVGGVTKDAKKQTDPAFVEVPYLRVANVQRGRLDLENVTRLRVPAAKAAALTLRPGDVLLNEGGDRDKLGRGWVWEGQIEGCIHQNHVFRARVRDDVLDPYLLSWAANSIGGPWCERNGKQSVNLASISLGRIRLMPVPVPPRSQQSRVRSRIEHTLETSVALRGELRKADTRSAALRRALLDAAFSGQLTGLARDDEVIEELAEA